jgi:biotin operon repressor
MNIDWDVETEGGGTYDNGSYRVVIKTIEDVEASTGSAQLRIKTEFLDGKYEGKQLTDHITLVETAAWKLVKFIKAMGVDIETVKSEIKDTNSKAFRTLLNKLVGKTTCWVVGQKARDGVNRNIVLDYKEDPKAEQKALEESWLE